MTDAVFERDRDRFVPTKQAGSPWADHLQHGGPPAGLLAWAIENLAANDEMRVVRLTVDLFRPVPMKPVTVAARSVREGKRIHSVDAVLTCEGVEVSRASGLLLRAAELPRAQAHGTIHPPSQPAGEDGWPPDSRHNAPRREGFHTASVIRRLPRTETGPSIAWIRVPDLIAGEPMSPIVRLAATCDFVNAVGSMGGGAGGGFINTDSTIYVHRPPAGEWICLQVERGIEADGIGVSSAVIFDRDGSVGRAAQAVLANEMR